VKKTTTKLIAFLMLVIMVVSALSACNTANNNNNNGDNGNSSVDEEIKGTEENPNLPEQDFGGHEFTFITNAKSSTNAYNVYFLDSDGETGETLPDAIYRRNALVEEKYNIKIKQYDVVDIVTEVRTQVMGGTVDFDAIIAPAYYVATLAMENLLYNLLDVELFNWDASYWDSKSKDQLMIANKLYFASCDINIHSIGFMVYFNKKILNDYNLTSPYQHMKDNTWTIDTWSTMVKSVSKDLNNDGAMTEVDLFGSLAEHHVPRMFLYASGVRATTNDATGYPQLTLMSDASKTVNIYEKVKEALNDSTHAYCTACSTVGANGYDDKYGYIQYMYTQDHFLFYPANDLALKSLAQMESEFGVAPFPKYTPEQETFQTVYPYHCTLFALPNVIPDINRTAAIIEDMNYYSSFITVPAWFDTLMARRYVRDDESEATLRVLRNNYVYDLGLYYNFGGIRKILDSEFHNGNISQTYDSLKKSIELNIKTAYKKFTKS